MGWEEVWVGKRLQVGRGLGWKRLGVERGLGWEEAWVGKRFSGKREGGKKLGSKEKGLVEASWRSKRRLKSWSLVWGGRRSSWIRRRISGRNREKGRGDLSVGWKSQ